jgi:Protein of unknown function (DUF1565)
MTGTSKATLTGGATIARDFSTVPGGCSPSSHVFMGDSSTLTLKKASVSNTGGTASVGINSLSRASLTLDSAKVIGHTAGGVVLGSKTKFVATGSLLQANLFGINAGGSASVTISGSTLSSNRIGILTGASIKLRNSKVTSNEVGIELNASSADLGQSGNLGNNTISGNSDTGVKFGANVASGTILAAGNTWNVSTQGSDGSGHYAQLLVSGTSTNPPASGTNFKLPPSSNFKIQF